MRAESSGTGGRLAVGRTGYEPRCPGRGENAMPNVLLDNLAPNRGDHPAPTRTHHQGAAFRRVRAPIREFHPGPRTRQGPIRSSSKEAGSWLMYCRRFPTRGCRSGWMT